MKVFRLSCAQGHGFEGWFASAEAFDRQCEAGDVACPVCEDRVVTRLPSAPYVNTGAREPATVPVAASPQPANPALAAALAALKAHVLAHTEDVGRRFPEVARRIHYGEEDARGIRGRVTPQEAAELVEEGIEAVPLPPGIDLDGKAH
ncbi:MAG: DUF1178 family protein [Burkholderiales bacterium]|nr:DUF1178 family protein [Burkholderiales bacterium]